MKNFLLIFLFPLLGIGQTQIGTDINGEAANNFSGSSVSLSSDGSVVAIGSSAEAGHGTGSGQVRIFKNISGVWTKQGQDINGEAAQDYSGNSISLSSDGSVIAIGARYNDDNGKDSGQVRVYKNVSGVWTQIGTDIDGEAFEDYSGWSVSLCSDGSVVAIGAPGNDGNGFYSGHVRIYKNVAGVWTQIGTDINGEAAFDQSGNSVSLSSDGNVVAIGAIYNAGNGTDSGQVRVYKNVAGVWTKLGADIDGKAAFDRIGSSLSLSSDGSVVAIGAPYNAGNGQYSGQVRVYKNVSGVWTQLGVDIDGEAVNDKSGSSVSISSNGSVVAIGAPLNAGNGTDSGSVRVYDLSAVLSSDSFVLAHFSVYPNPASDLITITLNEGLILKKVNIYNTLGQLVKTENKNTINVNSLSKGIYFLEIITDKGKASKKIIID